MNVIVSNRQKDIIDNANIDAIKDLNGLFNVNDLINKFKNYFFSKMILDATSVVDFASKEVLTTLADEIGAERLIILLPSNPEPPVEFKKLLIELKIYNFTNNIEDVVKFIEKPNTYEDAIKTVDDSYSSDVYVDNSIKDQEQTVDNNTNNVINNDFTGMEQNQSSLGDLLSHFNLNNSSVENTSDDNNINQQNLADEVITDGQVYQNVNQPDMSNVVTNMFEQNMSNVGNDFSNVQNDNGNKNTFLISGDFDETYVSSKPQKVVIGLKNVTSHAGCTSLIYMLHVMATVNLKKNVLSVEVGKNDFRLFRNNKMISTSENDVKTVIDNSNEEIVFVDLNNYDGSDICSDILYLVEPSTIKLNNLMATNRNVFNELKNEKVLLNKSLLSSSDVNVLEGEAGLKFFYNIPPLNDRIFNDTISVLLNLLGIK